jgi:proteasome lid subunit RPN8/RPN11
MDVKIQERPAGDRPADPSRDLGRADTSTWRQRGFPAPHRQDGVQVVFRQGVINDLRQHAHERTDVEICGVLAGNTYRDERGGFVYVEASIRGQHAGSHEAQVTFTAKTWNHIHNELDRNYPDLRILGWYHTHPGFGIFLSDMDLFIHENFFGAPEQLALVYDPLSGEEGLFVWREGKTHREGYTVVEDTTAWQPGALPAAATAAADRDLVPRLRRIEQLLKFTLAGVLVSLLFSIIWPLVYFSLAVPPSINDHGRSRLEPIGDSLDETPQTPMDHPTDEAAPRSPRGEKGNKARRSQEEWPLEAPDSES